MSSPNWLTDEQMALLQPYSPRAMGSPGSMIDTPVEEDEANEAWSYA